MASDMWSMGFRSPVLAIVAAMNEEEGIGLTLSELKRHLGKPWIIVVDGKSSDRTAEVAKDMDADVYLQEGLGKGDAIAQALKQVDRDIKYVVFTDADYTYPAEFVPRMIEILEKHPKVGMVCGNRFNHHLEVTAMRNTFYMGNRLLAYVHNLLNGVAMRDPLTGLRVVRWEALKDWVPKSKGFDIEVELNHLVERKGYGIEEIDISYRPRLGQKKLQLKHGVVILKRILLESAHHA